MGSSEMESQDGHMIDEFDALSISLETSTNLSKYPAKQHARSVAKHLGVRDGLIYLVGRQMRLEEDSDQPEPFKQRRYFYYITGADFEDCAVTYDIRKDQLCLFIPPVNQAEVIWLGPTPSFKECMNRFDVDYVRLTTDVTAYVYDWISGGKKSMIYVLHEGHRPEVASFYKKMFNTIDLLPAMDAARVIKSDHEVGLIERANQISSAAHRSVLLNMPDFSNETQIEAMFGAGCVYKGAKKQAYGIIAASGTNASTLHYVANDQPLAGRQLVCLDAGCEWDCYASDITRTFPISGTFTKEAQEIYDIVEQMQEQCIEKIKPGIVFRSLHILAMEIGVKGLIALGVLHNGTLEEILPTGRAFFPHGLGHHLGLELLADIESMHELQVPARNLKGGSISTLVEGRPYNGQQKLERNMVVTVEPGIYFSRYALEEVYLKDPKHAKFINKNLLEKYYPVGGVRIEDDILVTKDGYKNLTTAPKGEEACKIIRGEV